MTGTKKYEFSTVRLIAMTMIIFCHTFEYIGNTVTKNRHLEIIGNFLAVGVQIFLILSGYLYGNKKLFEKESRLYFVLRNAKKILLDYYVYMFLVIIPVYFICNFLNLGRKDLLLSCFRVLTFSGTIWGVHHLWFIPYILLCYFLTPLFFDIKTSNFYKKNSFVCFILCIVVSEILQFTFFPYFKAAWINCYILGFFLPKLNAILTREKHLFTYLIGFSLLCLTVALWYKTRYKLESLYITWGGVRMMVISHIKDYSFCFAALCIFSLIIITFQRRTMNNHFFVHILHFSDKYSYDIYIGHMIFIKGAASLLGFSSFYVGNIAVMLAATLASSVVLNFICAHIRQKIKYLACLGQAGNQEKTKETSYEL